MSKYNQNDIQMNSPIKKFIAFIDDGFLHMAISSQAESTLSEGSETTGEVESS